MRQLMLDIRPHVLSSLDNFIVGNNTALLASLGQQLAAQDGTWLYLWGAPGTGRTHLLRAAVAACVAKGRPALYLPADQAAMLNLATGLLVAVDDIDQLDPDAQSALFRALIQARDAQATLILAGNAPPQQLSLREDVRTRIGQALVFEVQALDDAHIGMLLLQTAAERGIPFDAEIVEYLLRHGNRDQAWLMSVLDALDDASLTEMRPVTLPLLREVLREEYEPELPF